MRKRIAIYFIAMMLFAVAGASGCGGGSLEKYAAQISDYRYAALRVSDARFVLDIIGGVREDPYVLDGESSADKINYVVFTLKPHGDYAAGAESLPLSVTIGVDSYSIQLSPHPFKGSYSAELAATLAGDCQSLELTLSGEELTAQACVPDAASGEYALTVALDAVGDSLKALSGYEVYLRLTENTVTASGGWYWFAAFTSPDTTISVLMKATDCEITALRK